MFIQYFVISPPHCFTRLELNFFERIILTIIALIRIIKWKYQGGTYIKDIKSSQLVVIHFSKEGDFQVRLQENARAAILKSFQPMWTLRYISCTNFFLDIDTSPSELVSKGIRFRRNISPGDVS